MSSATATASTMKTSSTPAGAGGGASSHKGSGGGGKSKTKTVVKAGGGAGTQAKAKKPARKKKPATSKTTGSGGSAGTTANQAVVNAARAAQLDIQKQKSLAAAKNSDPLWYRIEDVLPVVDANALSGQSTILPEQVSIVETVLQRNGLSRSDVTPQAMACLLEQARRYAQDLLQHAQDYAFMANRTELTKQDLHLAAEFRPDHKIAVATQLPKLNILAQHINRAPLPPIPNHCYAGVLLPPIEHQLTARTYDIVSSAQVQQRMVQTIPAAPVKSKKSTSNPSYGATKGRQIPIKLKQTQSTTTTSTATRMDITPEKSSIPSETGSKLSVDTGHAQAMDTGTAAALATSSSSVPMSSSPGDKSNVIPPSVRSDDT